MKTTAWWEKLIQILFWLFSFYAKEQFILSSGICKVLHFLTWRSSAACLIHILGNTTFKQYFPCNNNIRKSHCPYYQIQCSKKNIYMDQKREFTLNICRIRTIDNLKWLMAISVIVNTAILFEIEQGYKFIASKK